MSSSDSFGTSIQGEIIIIEPAANVQVGHMREKLEVIVKAVTSEGKKVTLVTWEPLSKPLATPGVKILTVWTFARFLSRLIPRKILAKHVDYCTYLQGFIHAGCRKIPVIGMTSSDPWGPLLASLFFPLPKRFLLRMLHPGVSLREGTSRVSPRRLGGFLKLAGRGAELVVFNDFLKKAIESSWAVPAKQRLHAVSEMMDYQEAPRPLPNRNVLLVSGFDNERRTPLGNLETIKDFAGLQEVILQHPSDQPLETFCRDWSQRPSSWRISRVTSYVTGKDWEELFVRSRFTLVAYDQNFVQSSGIFLQSVSFGRPVVSTRFPDALSLFEKHGRLGVLYDQDRPDTLRRALEEIISWRENEWREFCQARSRLVHDVDSVSVFRRYWEILHHRNRTQIDNGLT